jgi:pilus assembly protein CpaB
LKRRVLTVVLAALLAVVGAAAVLAYVRQANNRAVAGLKAESVLEALSPISAGTTLGQAKSQGLLTSVKIPQGSLTGVPVLAVNARNRKLVFSTAVGQGGLILQSMINTSASVGANGVLIIPTGMVAVTVEMCPWEAVAEYVTAGSNVAVFDTYIVGKSPKGQGAQSVQRSCDVSHQASFVGVNTRIVLTRAQVLAVGPSSASAQSSSTGFAATASAGSAGSQSTDPVMVTLAVSQADAERLIQIDEVGLPYMALLSNTSKTAFDPNTPLQLFR